MSRSIAIFLALSGFILVGCAASTEEGTEQEISAQSKEVESEKGALINFDPNTPHDQFMKMDHAIACLGIYSSIAGDEGKEVLATQYSDYHEPDALRKLDGFAKADYLSSLEEKTQEWTGDYQGNRYFIISTENRRGLPLREYNFNSRSFYDNSGITEGTSLSSSRGSGRATCDLTFVNNGQWKRNFIVEDEEEARKVDAARREGNVIVNVYSYAETGKTKVFSTTPHIDASIIRVEFTDNQGNLLAHGKPQMSAEELREEEESRRALCRRDPTRCM